MNKNRERFIYQDIPEDKALVIEPGQGEKLTANGSSCTFKLKSDHTNDQLGIYEIALNPKRTGAQLHYHRFMDETLIIMKGSLTIQLKEREIKLGEGGVIHIPRFTPHGFSNNSTEEAKVMLIFNPGQNREGFFYGLFNYLQNSDKNGKQFTRLYERYDSVIFDKN